MSAESLVINIIHLVGMPCILSEEIGVSKYLFIYISKEKQRINCCRL